MAYKYFTISHGLRGCYMPDCLVVDRFKTRREFKAFVMAERETLINAGYAVPSIKETVSFVAYVWRKPSQGLPHCWPYGDRGNRHSGMFFSAANRADYLADEGF